MATLYVRNLNEKTNLGVLRDTLRERFGEFGPILDICARKAIRMRGQAFVVFNDPEHASTARAALDGTELLGKQIVVALARQQSDAYIKETEGPEVVAQKKAARRAAPKAKRPFTDDSAKKERKKQKHANPPHNILFIEGLPSDITLTQLSQAYAESPGFIEARIFAARGLGFVEFASVPEATDALSRSMEFNGVPATVSYANK